MIGLLPADYLRPAHAILPAFNGNLLMTQVSAPIFYGAIQEVTKNTKAPCDLAVMAALTAASVVLQPLINIETPDGRVGPVGIMTIAMALSGERKTGVENAFLKEIRAYQKKIKSSHDLQLQDWQLGHDLWVQSMRAKKKELAKLQKLDDVEKCLEELRELNWSKPPRPRRKQLLYDDATVEGLLYSMHSNSKYAALVSSEGGSILNGRALRNLSLLNNLWSGSPCLVERKATESFEIIDGRITVSMMLQPSALKAYLERNGEEARGSGFLARILVFAPMSTQGTRFDYGVDASWEALDNFASRVNLLLQKVHTKLERDENATPTLQFDSDAGIFWTAVCNSIEGEIRPGGRFDGLQDHASKLGDNIARVAALLHGFENGLEDKIGLNILLEAIKICFYCSDNFARTFKNVPQSVKDTEELSAWFDKIRGSHLRYYKKNRILQNGPGCVRKINQLNEALANLESVGALRVIQYGKIFIVDLQPFYLPDIPRLQVEAGPINESRRDNNLL